MDEQKIKDIVSNSLIKLLPPLLRQNVNNIRSGVVTSVDTLNKTISVRLLSTSEDLNNVRYQNGATNVSVGDFCYVISDDPKTFRQVKALVF